mgnify:CR=1 FL=1
MSEMEFFHGYFEKSDLPLTPEDTDDFYELEEEYNCHFVMVKEELYKFWGSNLDVDAYGFNAVAEPTDKHQLLLYWYNGGAGIHEVAQSAIEEWLEKQHELRNTRDGNSCSYSDSHPSNPKG